ncbi:hypothetical protein CC1G_01241 [Coprinopsis cinerea okayama7|uniref:Uncharacterized protein n=1 Tax=Coprinopsis cinerea (strain Okayama-7 / 130 / ATCC MYA-4618 / FGSC 9003) TaxID=240176 RepID=A8NF03_COPC7|nr:hypothetical protein CC1G_01241 [Coprinopsis cinerea okayama7\|eukprot:XP_001833179.2 hypothetical protein CC1G_01241 [Coprinopsis cinerea okayama7\
MPEAPFENLLGLFTQIGKIQEMIEKGTSLSNIPDEFFTHIRRSIFAVAIGYQDRFLKIVSQDMMIHDVAAIVKDAASSSRISPTDAITRLHLLFHQRETYSHIWNDPTTRYGAAPHEPIPSTVNSSTM